MNQNFNLNPNYVATEFSNGTAALHPLWITGFTDGEGCFTISINRNPKLKIGWRIKQFFKISLHKKDKALLEYIQNYLGVGNIIKHGPQSIQFQVQSVEDLKVIINHFDKYPLITQKRADYELFKQAVELMEQKEHLTPEGLAKIVALKASMNTGLSEELKAAFPEILPVSRPSVLNSKIKDPHWLAGFTSGEGCFLVNIINSSSCRLGFQVQLVFQLTQHSRDEQLMRSLVEYVGCGKYYTRSGKNFGEFLVSTISDITDKIIPFFQNFPVQGIKRLDYLDWCKVAELMKNQDHLTVEGLEQIRTIKVGMNKGRS